MKPRVFCFSAACNHFRRDLFSNTLMLSVSLAVVGMGSQSAQAATYNWNSASVSSDWDANGSWTTAGFPNAIGDTANVVRNISADIAVGLSSGVTTGILNIGDTDQGNKFTIGVNGGNTITMNNGGAGAQITFSNGGNDTLAAPIIIADSAGLVISNNSSVSRTHSLTGGVTGTGNLTINYNQSGGGSGAFVISTGAINNTGTLTLNNTSTTGSGWTFSSNIGSNVTNLEKQGATGLTLSGASNSYTGTTTVTGGTLAFSGSIASTAATSIASGATLTLNSTAQWASGSYGGNISNAGTLNYNGTAAQTFSGNITGAGVLNVGSGAGAVTLSGASSSYGGGTTLASGTTLNINSATINNTSAGAVTLANNNNFTLGGTLTFTGTQNLSFGSGTATITGNRTISTTAGTLTIGSIDADTTARTLTKAGASGTLAITGAAGANFQGGYFTGAGTTLIGNKSALGTGTITLSGGTLSASADLSGANAVANTVTFSTGTTLGGSNNLTLGGAFTQTGSLTLGVTNTANTVLSGPVYLSEASGTGRTLTINGSGNATISGGIANFNGSGTAGNLAYSGTGILTLAGTNSFTGSLTVSGGGTVSVGSMSNALGTASSVVLGASGTTGRLLYTGTGETTGVVIASTSGTSGSSLILDQSGSGNLKFTSNLTPTGSTNGQTLILQGSTSGTGEFAGNIANSTGTGTPALSLTKSGTGTWTLSGSNTYTGATSVSNGTLNLDFSAATAPGGGTNLISSSSALNFGGTSGGGGTLNVIGKASTANTQTFASFTLGAGSNAISYAPGSGGSAAVTFTAVNTPGGAVHGTIQFGTTGTTTLTGVNQPTFLSGAESNLYATYGTDNWAVTNASGVVQAASYTNASSAFTTGVNNTVTGSFNSGAATPNSISVRFADATGRTVTMTNSTVQTMRGVLIASGAGASAINASSLNANNQIMNARATGAGIAGMDFNIIQNSVNDFTFGARLVNNAGSGSGTMALVKSGVGRVILANNTNAYTGGTYIIGGVLSVSENAHLGTAATAAAVTLNGGSLEATNTMSLDNGTNFRNVTLGTDGGGLYAASTKTLTVGASSVISGSGPLTINGSYSANGGTITDNGTVVLAASNTYTGATSVNAGKLVVSGSIGSSAVTVSGAGTTLASGTTGTIGSRVSMGSGSILAAGDVNTAGTATVNGAATFNDGSIFSWDINSTGTTYDKLIATGVADGGSTGGSIFRVVAADASFANAFWNQNQQWTDIFTTNGSSSIASWANLFTSIQVFNSSGSSITPVNGSFSVSGNTLSWSAVPEPSSALAGLLVGAGLLRRRRK